MIVGPTRSGGPTIMTEGFSKGCQNLISPDSNQVITIITTLQGTSPPPTHTHTHTLTHIFFFTPAVAAFNVLFGIALVSIDAVPLRLTQKIRNSCCCFVFLMITHSFVYLITESCDVKCSAVCHPPSTIKPKKNKESKVLLKVNSFNAKISYNQQHNTTRK